MKIHSRPVRRLVALGALFAIPLCHPGVHAQTGIGIGTTTPHSSAILDVTSTSQGFLPPRMGSAQMNAITAPEAGLMVYCTDCTPASLYLYANGWSPIGMAGHPAAAFTAGSLSCNDTLMGTYRHGTPMAPGNSKTISITPASGGVYHATTTAQNGVSFSAHGVLYTTGVATPVTLSATGTPQAAGTFTYPVSLGGQSCSFDVTFAPGATIACGSATSTFTPLKLISTATHSGTYTIPYTAGTGLPYAGITLTQNGISMTRTADTYSALGGNVVYTFSGTPISSNTIETFNLPEGCTIVLGCQNDLGNGTGTVVHMMYDNDGYDVNGTGVSPAYSWCAREVTAGGNVWLDRNLGANGVATSSRDAQSYGSLYQWGRMADGHQRAAAGRGVDDAASSTTAVLSTTDTPAHGNFITNTTLASDWRSGRNDALWHEQGGAILNNPCPSGFHVPSNAEFLSVVSGWATTNAHDDAIASPLKMTLASHRGNDGALTSSILARYWTITPIGNLASTFSISNGRRSFVAYGRGLGASVRCIKN